MSKKQYFLISSLAIAVLVGMVWSALFLMEPKAIPKIKWSSITSEDRISNGIAHILKIQIEKAPFIVIGLPSNEPKWIRLVSLQIRKLLEMNPLSQIWVTEELFEIKNELSDIEINSFIMSDPPGSPYSEIGKIFIKGSEQTQIIVTGLLDAVSYNQDSRGGWLRGHQKSTIHLLFADAILTREQEGTAHLPCDTSGKKFAVGQLGCDILNISRLNYRKIKKTEGLGFATSQISERDYLTVIKFLNLDSTSEVKSDDSN